MNFYFTLFEIMLLILFVVCIKHAVQEGLQTALRLIAGVLFGVLLEWATIKQLDAYSYGTFLIMVDNIPVMIGVAWGMILYSAMLFSDSTQLPWAARPLLDALLALNIDLAMDATAIRLGMWDWGRGLTHEYFGVPVENFWAWFWVIFCFSFFFRLFNHLKTNAKVWLAPLLALILGVVGVLATNLLIVKVIPEQFDWVSALALVLIALGILWRHREQLANRTSTHPLIYWVPLSFHIYFLVIGLISGILLQTPFLLLMGIAMLGLSYLLHKSSIQGSH